MKKILFVLSDLERGGIPRVTLNLIAALDTQIISVDVFCGNPRGIFLHQLKSSQARLLPCSLLLHAIMCNYRKEKGAFKYYAIFIKFCRCFIKKFLSTDILDTIEIHIGKKLSKNNYDAVFACCETISADISLQIKSSLRGVWIHNDYDHDCNANIAGLDKKLNKFDVIICVAKHALTSLTKHFPKISTKLCAIYNIVNAEEIIKRAEEVTARKCFPVDNIPNIISVGRFYETQKKFSRIPEICHELKRRGIKFRWYLIGNGSPEETKILLDARKRFCAENTFFILGEKENPYPYLKNASLFVLTSCYETYPTVVNEAKALGTPVISTNFKGVEEIIDPSEGTVTSIDHFADVIEQFCKKGSQDKNRYNFHAHNRAALEQFYKIIGY